MKKLLILPIMLFFCMAVFSQSSSDTIQIQKRLGTVYVMNGKQLTPNKMLPLMKSNEPAYQEMIIAKKNYNSAMVFGTIGGFLVGWPLGTAMAGGEPEWALAGVGAGLIAISIPFSVQYNKHAGSAVRMYNDGLRQKSTGQTKIDLRISLTSNGIGVRMAF